MLSLISSLVTNPTALIFLLLILGGLFRKWKVVKRSLWGMALVLTLLFTNQPLYDAAYRQWFAEYDHPLPEGKTYEYGYLIFLMHFFVFGEMWLSLWKDLFDYLFLRYEQIYFYSK